MQRRQPIVREPILIFPPNWGNHPSAYIFLYRDRREILLAYSSGANSVTVFVAGFDASFAFGVTPASPNAKFSAHDGVPT